MDSAFCDPVRSVAHRVTSWDLKIYRCLKVAVGMSDNSRYRYALATINPKSTAFGGYQETFLCFNNRVLTVTFVGRVVSTFFLYGPNRGPARCASVKFKFLRDIDDAVARGLLYVKANPPIGTESAISGVPFRKKR